MEHPIKKYECPVCGSSNVEVRAEEKFAQAPYGPAVPYEDLKLICKDCENTVDYTKVFEKKFDEALEQSRKESVEAIINDLTNSGNSLAYIERALELPQRTLSKWKASGELTYIGMALLRIIKTYPWILSVAENKFEPKYSSYCLVRNAVDEWFNPTVSSGGVTFKQFGVFQNTKIEFSSEARIMVWITGSLVGRGPNDVLNTEYVIVPEHSQLEYKV